MPQRKQRLAQQVGARITRHGEDVDVRRGHTAHLQARGNRVTRKPGDVLDPAIAFLLHRRDKLAGFSLAHRSANANDPMDAPEGLRRIERSRETVVRKT